jgi:FkbM family methyltransferase
VVILVVRSAILRLHGKQGNYIGKRDKVKQMLSQLIHRGDLAYDIGAHIGTKTLDMLAAGASKVIAIEPNPAVFTLAHPNIILVRKAVSNTNGKASFTACQVSTISTLADHWKSGRFAQCFSKADKVIEVETTTLDCLIEEFGLPNICKIDVEGHERKVLYGLTQIIPCLCFEFTKEFFSEAVECVSYLDKLGYEQFSYTSMVQEARAFDCPWTSAEHLLELIYFNLDKATDFWGDIYAKG